jgi:5-methyltetrahydrofolate--homocysteine methyltransferase
MDMQQKKARQMRFWQAPEKGEGGYLWVTSPVDDSGHALCTPPVPRDLEEQWFSAGYRVRRAEADAVNTYFGQDAIQGAPVYLGAGVQAAYLGAAYRLDVASVWFDRGPPLQDWNQPFNWRTDTSSVFFQASEAQTRALCAASQGRWAVPTTDIGTPMDVLYSLRGIDLMTDFLEYPDEVLAAQERLEHEILWNIQYLSNITGPSGCGYSGNMMILRDKPWSPLQCDMSVMISPAQFERFVLPSLDRMSAAMGGTVYHLDGPDAIRYLDMVLSLPHIHAIQYMPVPNPPTGLPGYIYRDFTEPETVDVYRRTLAAGKKACVFGIDPRHVKAIYDTLGTDGVFVKTECKTRKEADALIAYGQAHWINC